MLFRLYADSNAANKNNKVVSTPIARNEEKATMSTIIDKTREMAVVRSLDRAIAMSTKRSTVDTFAPRVRPPALPTLPRFRLSKVRVIFRLEASLTLCTAASNSFPSSHLA